MPRLVVPDDSEPRKLAPRKAATKKAVKPKKPAKTPEEREQEFIEKEQAKFIAWLLHDFRHENDEEFEYFEDRRYG